MSGLSRTPGKRVWVNSPPRVRIPPSPPIPGPDEARQGIGIMANPLMNHLLASLPDSDFQVLLSCLQLTSLTAGETLAEAGQPSFKIYFPIDALVAHSREMEDGLAIDTASVGADGMLGCGGLSGTPLHRLYVSQSGFAYRMDIADLKSAMASHTHIADMCMAGVQQILRKISIELACSHFHSLHQRVARWLLAQSDYGQTDSLVVTHQAIANSLGVRREAVSLTLPKLDGFSVSRGRLEITTRNLLEKACCECYFQLKATHPHQLKLPFGIGR